MARRGLRITMIAGILCIVLAFLTKLSLTQKDADIYSRSFHFLGVFDSNYKEILTDEEFSREIAAASAILVVQPLDDIKANAYAVEQKVKICEVLRGDEAPLSEIWIEEDNGIYNGDNWGMSNLMYPEHKYLVILDEMNGMYFNQFYMGAIAIDMEKTWNTIDLDQEYSYRELKNEKYFAADRETLELLYEREAYILKQF